MSSSNRSIFVRFFSFLGQFLFHHPRIGSSLHLQKSPWRIHPPVGFPETLGPSDDRRTVVSLLSFRAAPRMTHPQPTASVAVGVGWMMQMVLVLMFQKSGYSHQLRLRGNLSTIIYRVSKASQVAQDSWTSNRITKHFLWILPDFLLLDFCWLLIQIWTLQRYVQSTRHNFCCACWPWDIERVHSQNYVHSQQNSTLISNLQWGKIRILIPQPKTHEVENFDPKLCTASVASTIIMSSSHTFHGLT